MINLELPSRLRPLATRAAQVADEVFRPISRRYDRDEHTRPKELDTLAALIDGMEDAAGTGAGATGASRSNGSAGSNRNGTSMATAIGVMELSRGDVVLLLSMPRQGLGNSAIAAVADDAQRARFAGRWAAMAITEPEAGSDSAAIRTTAVLDGDEYVLNGEKIYVTAGERADLVVVWATLDRSRGRGAIKSFVVERSNPGLILERLDKKLGIRASDTAAFRLVDCRVPRENLLGSPEIEEGRGFAGAMQTFDNTRPLVAAMAVGLARACLDETERLVAEAGVDTDWERPQHAAVAELLARRTTRRPGC
jgi:acyl-CoA dehydrogenase